MSYCVSQNFIPKTTTLLMKMISECLIVTARNLVALQRYLGGLPEPARPFVAAETWPFLWFSLSVLLPFVQHHNPWKSQLETSRCQFSSCCRRSIAISVLTLLSLFAQLQFFALTKILNSMLSKRAWVERKSVLEPLLLETKQFSSTTLRMKLFPCSFFVRLQCFLPSLVL